MQLSLDTADSSMYSEASDTSDPGCMGDSIGESIYAEPWAARHNEEIWLHKSGQINTPHGN